MIKLLKAEIPIATKGLSTKKMGVIKKKTVTKYMLPSRKDFFIAALFSTVLSIKNS